MVLAEPSQKHRYVGGYVTEDNHFLFDFQRNSSGGKLFMMDLTKANLIGKFLIAED
jgi:prolyl oligopeptidase